MPDHVYDHRTPGLTLLIYNMVRNRLPFVVDNPANVSLLSNFTWEIMNQLEPCFRIATAKGTITPEDLTRIGQEENYSTIEQSIVADLVSVFILLLNASPALSGSGGGSSTAGLFLKKAVAGSVEVEYDQLKGSVLNSSAIGSENLLSYYRKSAINKAAQQGCIIEVCDDCSVSAILMAQSNVMPFIVVTGCGCG